MGAKCNLPESERDCTRCLKLWLIGKAKKGLAKEKEDKST